MMVGLIVLFSLLFGGALAAIGGLLVSLWQEFIEANPDRTEAAGAGEGSRDLQELPAHLPLQRNGS